MDLRWTGRSPDQPATNITDDLPSNECDQRAGAPGIPITIRVTVPERDTGGVRTPDRSGCWATIGHIAQLADRPWSASSAEGLTQGRIVEGRIDPSVNGVGQRSLNSNAVVCSGLSQSNEPPMVDWRAWSRRKLWCGFMLPPGCTPTCSSRRSSSSRRPVLAPGSLNAITPQQSRQLECWLTRPSPKRARRHCAGSRPNPIRSS
jgi:hypothetical protein